MTCSDNDPKILANNKSEDKVSNVIDSDLEDSDENIDKHESNYQYKKIGFFRSFKNQILRFKPILLSHHPICGKFEEHTFHLFGRDFCIGCFIGFPSGIIMLILGYVLDIFSSLSSISLWIIGLILLSSYLLSIFGLTKYKKIKIASKIFIGGGGAFFIAAIFSYPMMFIIKFILSIILVQVITIVLNLKRWLEIRETCKQCEYKSDWENCPGMNFAYSFHRNPEYSNPTETGDNKI